MVDSFTLAGVLTAPDGTVAAGARLRVRLVNAIATASDTSAAGTTDVTTDASGAYSVTLPAVNTAGAAAFYVLSDLTGASGVSQFTFQAPASGTVSLLDLATGTVMTPTDLDTARAYADAAVAGLVVDNGDGTLTIG